MEAHRPGEILLVENDSVLANAISAALGRAGHNVTHVQSGTDARRALTSKPYDVALIDRTLPDDTGDGVCTFIKSTPDLSHTAVGLLVNGRNDLDWSLEAGVAGGAGHGAARQQAVSYPPNDLIGKSASAPEIVVRVQSLMRQRRYVEEIQNTINTLMRVAEGVEEQDKRARGHCQRLSIMAVQLGSVLGCDDWQLTTLERAGYLHDIGRVSIPGAIIDKAQPLSPREMEIIRDHCVLGEKLLADVAGLQSVIPIIRHHHERTDGSGYPDGLRGDQIPVLAQIFSVVDVYDALRMWRPFRPSMSEMQAIDIMRQEVGRGFWNRFIFNAFNEKVLPGLEQTLDSMHILWP